MRFERRRAIRTYDAEVLEPVVCSYAIDVIEDERHGAAVPPLALTAELALTLLQSCVVQAALEVEPAVVRMFHEDLIERDLVPWSRSSEHPVRVEMVRRDPVVRDQLL
jgi:hypothetical protein